MPAARCSKKGRLSEKENRPNVDGIRRGLSVQQNGTEIAAHMIDGFGKVGGLLCAALRERAASAAVTGQRRIDRADQNAHVGLDAVGREQIGHAIAGVRKQDGQRVAVHRRAGEGPQTLCVDVFEHAHEQLDAADVLRLADQRLSQVFVERGVCLPQLLFGIRKVLALFLHRRLRLVPRGREAECDRADGVLHLLRMPKRAHSAQEGAARAALIGDRLDDLELPDLAGAPHVRRAAGARVAALDRHNADRRGEPLRMLSKRNALQVLFGFIDLRRDRRVFGGEAVGKVLDRGDVLVPDRFVQIERRITQRAVEAHVLCAEQVPCAVGEQMLAGVLLHDIEPPRKVELAMHRGSRSNRAVGTVQKPFALLVHVQHLRVADRADVAGLTALVGEERALIEFHKIPVALRFAGEDRCVERAQHAVKKV